MRNVLIPVDVGEPSTHAANWYLNNLRRDDDRVLLVHVVEPSLTGESVDNCPPAHLANLLSSSMERSMQRSKELQEIYKNIFDEANMSYQFQTTFGSKPGENLLEVIQKNGITCVVMASRGRNMIERALLGTVSDFIVHHVSIPVIVVPPVSKR